MKIKLTLPTKCACDEYEMTHHPRSGYTPKPELPEGTILEVLHGFTNLYGRYYHCEGGYDIPVWCAEEILNL